MHARALLACHVDHEGLLAPAAQAPTHPYSRRETTFEKAGIWHALWALAAGRCMAAAWTAPSSCAAHVQLPAYGRCSKAHQKPLRPGVRHAADTCSSAWRRPHRACSTSTRVPHVVQARVDIDSTPPALRSTHQQQPNTVQTTARHGLLGKSVHDADIFRLAVPAILALAADPLLGVIDTAFIGRLGEDSLAALGVNASLFSLCFVVFNFLATATTTLVAGAASGSNQRVAGEVAWQASGLALLLGCSVTGLLWMYGTQALDLMGIDPAQQQLHDLAMSYLVWRAGAAPAVLLVTVGQGIFRGLQNMRTPLLITVLTNLVHLGLDGALIFGLHMGLQGAAVSTTVSEWAAAGLYGVLLWRQRHLLGLWPPPSLNWQQLRSRYLPFLQAGSAVLMRTGALLSTKTMATAVATHLGPSSVASHQVLMQLWVLTSMLVDSLAVSGQTLIAVKLGSGQKQEARQVSERLLQLGLLLGLGITALLGVASPLWPHIFTSDTGVLEQIQELVPLAVLPLPINALVYTLDGVLVGAADFGYMMSAMVSVSAAAAGLLFCVEPNGWGLQGVWAAMAALMVGRLAALGLRYQSSTGPLPPAAGPALADGSTATESIDATSSMDGQQGH